MPNRIIKESICTSDNLNSLTPEEEVFFYRLIVSCDDFGVTDARAPIIRARCFPLKLEKYSEKKIEEWLHKLVSADLIYMYEVDGKRYLKMTSWENHQQIRAKKSKYPLPDSEGANLISNDINGNQDKSDDGICHRNPIQSNPNPNPNPNTNARARVKNKYAEFVTLYEEEYQKLVDEYGEAITKRMIEILDNYKGANGKKYKSDYRAILNWVVDRVKSEQPRKGSNSWGALRTLDEKYRNMEGGNEPERNNQNFCNTDGGLSEV